MLLALACSRSLRERAAVITIAALMVQRSPNQPGEHTHWPKTHVLGCAAPDWLRAFDAFSSFNGRAPTDAFSSFNGRAPTAAKGETVRPPHWADVSHCPPPIARWPKAEERQWSPIQPGAQRQRACIDDDA